MNTKHTCNDGRPPVFGRKAPLGECKRCDELRFGMPARGGWGDAAKRDRGLRAAAIRHHYTGDNCKCGPVCVRFDP